MNERVRVEDLPLHFPIFRCVEWHTIQTQYTFPLIPYESSQESTRTSIYLYLRLQAWKRGKQGKARHMITEAPSIGTGDEEQ